jgi:hypothetical protein
MTNLLRFDFNDRDGVFEVIENGDWVRATDYDALAAKLADVEARINEGENKLALAIAELERLGFDFESIVGRKLKGQTE